MNRAELSPLMHPVPAVQSTEDLLFAVLVQLIVVIGAARLFHVLFRRVGLPGVVGEIVAGLVLGPSCFGFFFPDIAKALFGGGGAAMSVISQIGLIFLMFQIGADFEFGLLQSRRLKASVLLVAAASLIVPFVFGMGLGLASWPVFAPTIDRLAYSLFLGVAVAITAVPILGRILAQYDMTRAEVGVVAISAAAVNDVVGWVALAGISAYAASRFSSLRMAAVIGGIALLTVLLRFVLRPLVDRLLKALPPRDGELQPSLVAVVMCLIFALAICTYKLGIFAIFGGFGAGLLFFRDRVFVEAWRKQVGEFVSVFFLPVFFLYTGLHTNLLGLTTPSDLMWLALVLLAAVLGKIVPVYLAARLSGFQHHDASLLGVLMNTRALMELIVLNVGHELGVIPQRIFTMLVVMAVVTTVMTGPLLKLRARRR